MSSKQQNRRVGLIGPLPPPRGGVSMHMARLRSRLQGSDWDVRSMATGWKPPEQATEDFLGNSPIRHAWVPLRAKLPLVHLHHSISPLTWTVLRAAKAAGSRVVLTIHGDPLNIFTRRISADWFLRGALRSADWVIAVNERLAESLAPVSGHERFSCIPAFLAPARSELEMTHDDSREWFEQEPHVPLLTFAVYRVLSSLPGAGGESDIYGINLVTEAMESIHGTHDGLRLACLLAQPPRSAKEKQYLDEHVARLKTLFGDRFEVFVGAPAVPLIARSLIFLRPSFSDGDSVAIREALSLGITVVASDVVARPDGVTLFETGSVPQLASRLRDSLRASESNRASPEDSHFRQIEQVYQRALARNDVSA